MTTLKDIGQEKGGALYVGKTGPVMRIPMKLVHIEMIMWTLRVFFTTNLDHLLGTMFVNIVPELTFLVKFGPLIIS